jgi:hypothetical protein
VEVPSQVLVLGYGTYMIPYKDIFVTDFNLHRLPAKDIRMIVDRGYDFPAEVQSQLDSL